MTDPTSAPLLPVPAARPLLFRAGEHTCVAWWHAPAEQAGAAPVAVVLASSWGEEDMSGYDGQRALAVRLAQAGLGTLRFEWPDTGDSSAETSQATVADALAAFDAAADVALARSGCRRLAFIGMRLGALLAAHAATSRRDVEAFVGLLPVASGRAFVREQRLLGARLHGAPAPGGEGETTQLGGFPLSAARAADFSALKWPLPAGDATAVREALLLAHADAPSRPAAQALGLLGVRVSEWAHSDLLETLAIAHQARLSPAVVTEIVHWLHRRTREAEPPAEAPRAPAAPVPAQPAEAWLRTHAGGSPVRERLCEIGDESGALDDAACHTLVGVLSERDLPAHLEDAARAPRRGVLLLSSGRERRVGPHRIWVPFARHRAGRGDVVLRLDIAGIGDSAARANPDADGTPALYDSHCVEDIARAVAWLRREHGVGDCTLVGVCSGAYHAWRAALAGVDVQQVVPVNPLVFHWRAGLSLDPMTHSFGQIAVAANARRGLRDPARWLKLLRGRANIGVIARALAGRARHALRLRLRDLARVLRWPLRADLGAELAQVCGRGVAVDFVFSTDEPGATLLRDESGRLGMRLRRDSLLKVCEVEHADHTFAGTAGRLALYARLDTLLEPAPSMTAVLPVNLARHPAPAQP